MSSKLYLKNAISEIEQTWENGRVRETERLNKGDTL